MAHALDRFKASDRVTDIVVCTSHRPEDDEIARICRQEGVVCHRSKLSENGNLVGLLDEALQMNAPDAQYVFRGLCDGAPVTMTGQVLTISGGFELNTWPM